MSIKLKGSTAGSVALDAPANTSPSGSDIALTLPIDAGSANQFLKNGSTAGELEYSSMVEDSSGRLLVGTTSVSHNSKAVIAGRSDANAAGTLVLESTSSSPGNGDTLGNLRYGTSGNTGSLAAAAVGAERDGGTWTNNSSMPARLVFSTTADGASSPTARMRLNSGGGLNVGSGVLSAGSGDGNIVVDEGIYIGTFNGDNQIRSSSAGGGSATLYIGNAAIQVSSDRRLKENIVDTVVDAAEELKRVRVVDFTWNDPSDTSFNNRNARGTWTGLIAQELVDVFPFAVNAPRAEEDLSIDQDSEKRWLVDQDQLVPVLIKGFQQALARIETLETQNTAQQTQIDDLLARVTALEAA